MKNKQEIIEETINYYTEDPSRRALLEPDNLKNSVCEYYTEDGRTCAIGRVMLNPKNVPMGDVFSLARGTDNLNIDSYLKEEYRGHNIEFWNELQQFHDLGRYWTEEELTEEGKKCVEKLKKDYSEN